MSTINYRRANSPFLHRHNFETNTAESICSDRSTPRFEQYRAVVNKTDLINELSDEEADIIPDSVYERERVKAKKIIAKL